MLLYNITIHEQNMVNFIRTISSKWNTVDKTQYKDSIVFIEDTKQIYTNGVYYFQEIPDTSFMVAITYDELKTLKDNGDLIPGLSYRIIDYVTLTKSSDLYHSEAHQFDLIVIADSANTLNENARAIQHDGDTYFSNSNLAAWKIKYTIDNDSFYSFIDDTCKGVIYEMTDEFNNTCPYDFKNILQVRYLVSGTNTNADNKYLGWVGYGYNQDSHVYCYTFSKNTNGVSEDISLNATTNVEGNVISCSNNKISQLIMSGYCHLNDVIFICDDDYSQTISKKLENIVLGDLNYNMSFGPQCYNISTGNDCHDIIFSDFNREVKLLDYCRTMIFGRDCYGFQIGSDCSNLTAGNTCFSFTIGNECYNMSVGTNCRRFNIGNYCRDWELGDNCQILSTGNNCSGWLTGDNCSFWSCGNQCYEWHVGDNCASWRAGNSCNNWSTGNSCSRWSCGNECYGWNVGTECDDWSTGNNCYNWSTIDNCKKWRVGNGCHDWSTGSNCSNWSTRNECFDWSVGDNSIDWSTGNNCYGWSTKTNCQAWSVGDNCHTWSVGNYCIAWSVGNRCYNWVFGAQGAPKDYYNSITVENYNHNFCLNTLYTTSSSKICRGIHVAEMAFASLTDWTNYSLTEANGNVNQLFCTTIGKAGDKKLTVS